eukprot:gene26601-biopygen16971
MNLYHEECVRDRKRSGMEAADPVLRFQLNSGREHHPRS